jgi:acyl-CoA synthetase (AMP-forming)/AMP-acid ligase II
MRWSRCCDLFDWPWRHWRQRRGEAQALRLNDQPLTWRELCARVDALAAGFAAQGVMEGQGVALRAYNQPETLLAWLALLQCGARVLPLNPQLPAVAAGTAASVNRPASAGAEWRCAAGGFTGVNPAGGSGNPCCAGMAIVWCR